MKGLGAILLIIGCVQLLLNEFIVQIRRIWRWRRDDSSPKRDQFLKDFYRFNIYATGIVYTELGCLMVDPSPFVLPVRIAVYVLLGTYLFMRHPVLRSREFWRQVPYRGRAAK